MEDVVEGLRENETVPEREAESPEMEMAGEQESGVG